MTRTLRSAIALAMALGIIGFLPRLASAQPWGHPAITSVHVDFDQFRLRILGDHFGASPAVWLGERRLEVESATNTEISALLGGPLDPGSYLVTVGRSSKRHGWGDDDDKKRGSAQFLFSSFNITIGVQGPQGEKGDTGAQGPPGNDGRDGADGQDGTNGMDGASPFALNGNNAVYLQGNVGVGTPAPTALVQAGAGQDYGQITTLGVSQRPNDTVALSLRSASQNPVFQFCNGDCNYVEMERDTFNLALGTNGQGGRMGPSPSTMIVQRHDRGGSVGIGTRGPTAQLQVGDPMGHPNHFGNVTTFGVWQQPGDTVALSVRRGDGGNPTQQFCFNDCNYIEMHAPSTDLWFGARGGVVPPTMTVRRRDMQAGGVGIHQAPEAPHALAVGGSVIANVYVTRSSRRLKSNIETLGGALDLVGRMRGVSYTVKATGKQEIGLIAEEVGEVLPQVVAYAGDETQGVDYARLVAVLIEAVKEQQAQIQSLRQELTALAAASQK